MSFFQINGCLVKKGKNRIFLCKTGLNDGYVEVDFSKYEWVSPLLQSSFFYIELEKMRGRKVSFGDLKRLEEFLTKKLKSYSLGEATFWPYNHEEAYKQLLVLAKEVSSRKDYPQVSIHFQKQTLSSVEFSIHLVRPKGGYPKRKFIKGDRLPSSVRFTSLLREELRAKVICLAEVFSLTLPMKDFRVEGSVNLLLAREHISSLIRNEVGIFRDYNGGLFEKQKEAFKKVVEKFSDKIPQFSLFAEELFYSIAPIEAQLCLDDSLWEELFMGFSKAIHLKTPFSGEVSERLSILKRDTLKDLEPFLEKAKKLSKRDKIIAYLRCEFLSESYLLILYDQRLPSRFFLQKKLDEEKALRLSFEEKIPPSLDPYYLEMELRGRTLSKFLYEGLVRINPKGEVEYAGCEKVTILENGTKYLFVLRDVRWSNGTLVTAFQYEEAWKERLLKKDRGTPLSLLKNARKIHSSYHPIEMLGVKALNDRILEVELEKKSDDFLKKLSTPSFLPFKKESPELSLFNGSYCVKKRSKNEIVLTQNPYYLRKDNLFFREVTLSFGVSTKKKQEFFKSGKIDWLGACSVSNFPNLESKQIFFPFLIYLNTSEGILSSPFIRRALSYSIDRPEIIKKIFPGNFSFSNSLQISPIFRSIHKLRDTKKSQELFSFGLKELGDLDVSTQSIDLCFCNLDSHVNLANYLKRTWEEILGLRVNVRLFDWNFLYRDVEQKKFEACGFFDYPPAGDLTLFMEQFCDKKKNLSSWESKDFKKKFLLAKETKEREKQRENLIELEKILLDSTPFIPLFNMNYFYAASKGLTDYLIDKDGSVDFRYAFKSMP